MRHHFGDLLDRDGDYWTIVPNRERYAHGIATLPEDGTGVTIVTLGKLDTDWRRVLALPDLVELTLHEPSLDQLEAIAALQGVRRLRVTHARPKDIDFIGTMHGLEEVVLEYVSGFSDLAPLAGLPQLRALHLENLRRVCSLGGLAGCATLRYLSVNGTCDWLQPVADFEFLRGLPALEVLSLWQFKCAAPWPAMLPATALRHLKRLRLHGSYLPTAEYALLEEILPGVDGATWGPWHRNAQWRVELPEDDPRAALTDDELRDRHPEVTLTDDGRQIEEEESAWYEFTGRGAGRIKGNSALAASRREEHARCYEDMKRQARALLTGT